MEGSRWPRSRALGQQCPAEAGRRGTRPCLLVLVQVHIGHGDGGPKAHTQRRGHCRTRAGGTAWPAICSPGSIQTGGLCHHEATQGSPSQAARRERRRRSREEAAGPAPRNQPPPRVPRASSRAPSPAEEARGGPPVAQDQKEAPGAAPWLRGLCTPDTAESHRPEQRRRPRQGRAEGEEAGARGPWV